MKKKKKKGGKVKVRKTVIWFNSIIYGQLGRMRVSTVRKLPTASSKSLKSRDSRWENLCISVTNCFTLLLGLGLSLINSKKFGVTATLVK